MLITTGPHFLRGGGCCPYFPNNEQPEFVKPPPWSARNSIPIHPGWNRQLRSFCPNLRKTTGSSKWSWKMFGKSITSWWFQPIWKNISQVGSFAQVGMKIKNLWNHHLDKPIFPNMVELPSLKLAFPPLKNGWLEDGISFWDSAYCQGKKVQGGSKLAESFENTPIVS